MLSIDYIRNNKEKVLAAAKNKGREVELDKIITLDDDRRLLIQKAQKLREERNKTHTHQPGQAEFKAD